MGAPVRRLTVRNSSRIPTLDEERALRLGSELAAEAALLLAAGCAAAAELRRRASADAARDEAAAKQRAALARRVDAAARDLGEVAGTTSEIARVLRRVQCGYTLPE